MKIKGFSQASAQDYATSEAISLHFLYQTRSLASCGKVDLNLIDFEGHSQRTSVSVGRMYVVFSLVSTIALSQGHERYRK
jgi:hypothetical protein